MDLTREMTTGPRTRARGSRAAIVAVAVVVAFLATAAPLRPSPASAEVPPGAPEAGKLPPDTTPPPELPVPSAMATPGDPATVTPPPPAPPGLKAGEELVERRTATSKTFATDKAGEFVTKLHAAPVHYRGAGWALGRYRRQPG